MPIASFRNITCNFHGLFLKKKRERVRSYLPSNPLGITPSVTGPPTSFSHNITCNFHEAKKEEGL